jgi:hypothetical protein
VATDVNEAAYSISGNFGEAFYIDPTGVRPPLKIMECTELTFTKEIAVEDVQLSGNRSGTKDGAELPGSFSMTVRKIDHWWENIVAEALNQNLAARRAARDSGVRIPRTFTLQVWEDDPEALGAIGHQLEGCRLSVYMGGFSFGETITSRQHAGRFERVRKLRAFERLGNQVDAVTGLPAIKYTDDLNIAPGSGA